MGGSSTDKKRKMKGKREKVSNDSINPEEINKVDFTPALISPSSSSYVTKKLVFWGKELFDKKLSFYAVDISIDHLKHQKPKLSIESVFDHRLLHTSVAGEQTLNTSTPIFTFSLNSIQSVPLFLNTFATADSLIYSVGGLFTRPNPWRKDTSGTNLVHYFDISTPPENTSWKPTTPMIASRQNPQVIIANGIVYVFGCFGSEKCPHTPTCVWAERFDSSTHEWSSLPVPMFEHSLIVCSSNPKNQYHVIQKISALVDHGRFYEFHLKTNSWSCIAHYEKNFSGIISRPVMVNKVLYWFGEDVYAYDILKDTNFEGPVQELSFQRAMRQSANPGSDNGVRNISPAILHLGGRYFCLLGSLPDVEENGLIHCLVIKVSKTNDCYKLYHNERRDVNKFFMSARVIGCQSFPVDRQLGFLDGGLMMI